MPDSENLSLYDLFIVLLILCSLIVAVLIVLPDTDPATRRSLTRLDVLLCLVLLGDFFARFQQVENKRKWLLAGNWMDFVGSLPALPGLRLFRLFRIIRVVRTLRQTRTRALWHKMISKRAANSVWGMLIIVLVAIVVAGAWVERVEQDVCTLDTSANICSFQDGIWWAFVTVTTVGYGDHYPVSDTGRALAAVLMIIGVGLFGVLTSYLASIFVHDDTNAQEETLAAIQRELRELRALLEEQRAERDP